MKNRQLNQVFLDKLYSVDFGERIIETIPTWDQGWLINFDKSPDVVRLDSRLNVLWRKDLQAQTQAYHYCRLATSPDGNMIALSGRDFIRVTDQKGNLIHQIEHLPWQSYSSTQCCFSADSRYFWFATPTANEGTDLLQVVDTQSFTVRANTPVVGWYGHYAFHQTPQVDTILLDIAAGQDDSGLCLVHFTNGLLQLTELTQCLDRVMGNFAPSGTEFVTAPHGDGVIRVYSFPQISEIASIEEEEVFGELEEDSQVEEDMFDFYAKYFTKDYILTKTRYNRLLLIDRQQMQCTAELVPEGYQINGYDQRGKFTEDPASIISYEGDIDDFFITPDQELFTVHHQTYLAIYNTENIRNKR